LFLCVYIKITQHVFNVFSYLIFKLSVIINK